ncbi:MAG: 50S ribosomal protein L30 [Sandaracinaceae bacterium]|jgi:large subunit ribosomal protein L30|nr:50S ribosomal protein L30 [Sandaracinaceae bacterium]
MTLKLTLVRSAIGRPEKHRRVLKGLGLRGLNSQVTVANTPAFRGMIKKVLHLVTVEESNG